MAVPPPAMIARDERAGTPPRSARAIASPTFSMAISPSAAGEPTAGMTTNGTRNVPVIAPRVLTESSSPARLPTLASEPPTRPEAAGKLRPMMKVAGRTTSAVVTRNEPNRAPAES